MPPAPTVSSGSGTVYYTDGSTSTFELTLASYLGPPDPGNDIVAVLPYVNGGPAGQSEQTAYVFYAGVPITPAKTVQAVTLPRHGSGPPGGMHIFAVGIGPLRLPGTPSGSIGLTHLGRDRLRVSRRRPRPRRSAGAEPA